MREHIKTEEDFRDMAADIALGLLSLPIPEFEKLKLAYLNGLTEGMDLTTAIYRDPALITPLK